MIKRLKIYKPTKTTKRPGAGVSVGIPCQELNCVTEANSMADIGLFNNTWRFWSCELHVTKLEDLFSELELSQ
jgi:hypothetical protein